MNRYLLTLIGILCSFGLYAQEDSTAVEEEDWSIYDDLDYADEGTKSYANAKISGLSPARFISIGYDFQGPYELRAGSTLEGSVADLNNSIQEEVGQVTSTQGIRVAANIPVYSTNKLIVQVGGQFWDMNYGFENADNLTHPLLRTLSENGLRTVGLNSTIYKPLNEYAFILVQLGADMNGDWDYLSFQPLEHTRYQAAALWGRRPSDYVQWAIGASRTYRAGEMNYVPILMFNWTSKTSKWGAEMLLPARGHMRYSFNRQSMLMLGFALEGNSYLIGNQNPGFYNNNLEDLEIRRSELRFRAMYQRKLVGFIWASAEVGYRYNYLFDVDEVPGGQDFFRGFFGTQPYAFQNQMGNPVYFNVSLNLVSP
jgi:hypothetical protein